MGNYLNISLYSNTPTRWLLLIINQYILYIYILNYTRMYCKLYTIVSTPYAK